MVSASQSSWTVEKPVEKGAPSARLLMTVLFSLAGPGEARGEEQQSEHGSRSSHRGSPRLPACLLAPPRAPQNSGKLTWCAKVQALHRHALLVDGAEDVNLLCVSVCVQRQEKKGRCSGGARAAGAHPSPCHAGNPSSLQPPWRTSPDAGQAPYLRLRGLIQHAPAMPCPGGGAWMEAVTRRLRILLPSASCEGWAGRQGRDGAGCHNQWVSSRAGRRTHACACCL